MVNCSLLPFLLAGVSLGAAAGISPGPLLALLVSQTLRHGLREGVKVSFAPVLSDAPVVVLCIVLLRGVAGPGPAAAWISIAGGCFVAYLGYDCLRATAMSAGPVSAAPRSLAKAVAVNFVNPHVWIFWATVGAPMLLNGWRRSGGSAFAFLAGFYLCLIGSKLLVAVLVNRSRTVLTGPGYRWVIRVMGALLVAVAVWMVANGVAAAR